MKRLLLAAALALSLAACGGSDSAEKKIRDATEDVRSGGREAVDRAEEALEQLEDSDLPDDARRELEEAKRLLEEAGGG